MSSGMYRAAIAGVLACAALVIVASTAFAENVRSVAALSEQDVVALAAKHNPGLRASLLELENARWDVFGEEARDAPVLVLDASATQTSNPNLFREEVSINRIRRADAGAEIRKHMVWGTDLTLRVATNVQVARSNLSFGATPAGTFGPGYGMLAKLSLKQPLLRGRGREVGEADRLAARVRQSSAEHARDRVASELLRDALTAYWELWYADAALGIQEQARSVATRQRDEAAARASSGALAPAEVLAFETQVATREEDVLTARVERERRELELLQRLGLIEDRPSLSLAASDVPAPTVSVEAAEQRALAQSAQLHELEAAAELAQLQNKTAADPLRTRLDLDAYVQAQGLGNEDAAAAASQFGQLEAVSAFVGLTYEAPLNDHAHRAAAAKARLSVEVAAQQLAQARQQVVSDVRVALERHGAGERKVQLSEQTLKFAQRQLEAEQARFDTGTATPLAVVEAEDQVRAAQLRLARARADLLETALSLSHLTGELLDRYAALGVKASGP